MTGPAWLAEAIKHEGVSEVRGPKTSDYISRWLNHLGAWWSGDEVPWCGTFVAHCVDAAGLPTPKLWMRAKAWASWGTKLPAPATGCVVVFERSGGGHVGFVVGRTANGNLMVIGGNQGNRVSVAEFHRARVIGYYWPPGVSLPIPQGLIVMASKNLNIDEA